MDGCVRNENLSRNVRTSASWQGMNMESAWTCGPGLRLDRSSIFSAIYQKVTLVRDEVSSQMMFSSLNQSQSLFASHNRWCCISLVGTHKWSVGCELETGEEELAVRIRQSCQQLLLLLWHREVLCLNRHAGWLYTDETDRWYEMIQPKKPKGIRILILSFRELHPII